MARFKFPELMDPSNIDSEDRSLLESLYENPPGLVLVASDLHLGSGFDAETGMYAAEENFLADDAFGRWLDNYSDDAADGALLVLNGDTFDFLRITRTPESPQEFEEWADLLDSLGEEKLAVDLRRAAACPEDKWRRSRRRFIVRRERRLGLRTNDYKTVWKLQAICEGHKAFFEALATWLRRGGSLIITKGNHDLEIYWPLVRRAIRRCIVNGGAIGVALSSAERSFGNQIGFVQDWFTLKNLYLEHGHRYEKWTRVPVPADWLIRNKGRHEVPIPPGSLVNRHFINKMERLSPFADNQKPATEAMMSILRVHPLKVFGVCFRALPLVLTGLPLKRFWMVYAAAVVALTPPVVGIVLLLVRFLSESGFAKPGHVWLPILLILFPFVIPYAAGALGEVCRESVRQMRRLARLLSLVRFRRIARWVDKVEPELNGAMDRLRDTMEGTDEVERLYAVMGHNHKQRIHLLTPADANHKPRKYYANSGTWIPLWHKNRPDLLGQVIFGFLEFRLDAEEYRLAAGGREHAPSMWNDSARESRRSTVLAPAADAR